MRESDFQAELIKDLKEAFPGCVVQKNDAGYSQGYPDLTIYYGAYWACLEIKKSAKASHRPNQDWWIEKLNSMSYAAFVYPENKEEILDELRVLFLS